MEGRAESHKDVIMMARQLRDLLVKHEKISEEIQAIDKKICHINRRIVCSDLCPRSGSQSILHLRLSSMKGIRQVYKQYRQRTMRQVQKFTKQIVAELTSDDEPQQMQQIENEVETVPVTMDSSAIAYTNNDRECHRME